jgi:ribosomal protein S21
MLVPQVVGRTSHGEQEDSGRWERQTLLNRHRQAGTRMVLDGPEELELALRLFRDDTLMAKREAKRKQYFVAPSTRRKIKSLAARRRAARARRKRSGIVQG